MGTDDAVALRDRLASGALRAEELAEALIARVGAAPDLGAWAWFEPDFLRAQARAADAARKAGRAIGPLHGLPVGIKDCIDTAKIPTENGAVADRGRVPRTDAAAVRRLRAAGALVMGKTATTELAFMQPAATRNPHDPERTPGGSSAGSAAAVAAGMAPLTIGTQTGGSVIRPASFCGVTGYKPSFGAVPTDGVLRQSPSLDTLGAFAASPRDAALIGDVLMAGDDGPPPRLLGTVQDGAPLPPVFAVLRLPGWDAADEGARDAFDELQEALGEQAFSAPYPALFEEASAMRRRINLAEMARCYAGYSGRGLSEVTQAAIDEGGRVLARDYLAALEWPRVLNAALDEIFGRCDAVLCLSAPGPAPGRETTGDPVFNGIWTLCGVPAVTVPVLSVEGMPLGVQLVGPRGGDARLLRTAQWLYDQAEEDGT